MPKSVILSFFSILIVVLIGSSPVAATMPVYKLDPAHTRVVYFINHLGFSDMPGQFTNITGEIAFDPEKPEQSKLNVTIDATAVTMGVKALDDKLQKAEFFNTEKYPTLTFVSTKIVRTGTNRGTVTGDLTLLGVTKPVTLKVTFNKKGWNQYAGAEQVGFSAWGKLNRSDFGMKAYLPAVGDTVTFRIEAEAAQPKAQAQKAVTPSKTN